MSNGEPEIWGAGGGGGRGYSDGSDYYGACLRSCLRAPPLR